VYILHRAAKINRNLQPLYDAVWKLHKNSSGDEIANANFFRTISHTYQKREPTSFNKSDDS